MIFNSVSFYTVSTLPRLFLQTLSIKTFLPFIGYQAQIYPGYISSNYFKALACQL